MPSLNRVTGQVGQTAKDPVAQLGGMEKIAKRKVSYSTDYQNQELYNIKETYRIVNMGFKQLRIGRTH